MADEQQQQATQQLTDSGGFLLPHQRTFSAIYNAFSQVYRYTWDEAVKHSPINAMAMRRDAFIMGVLQERYLQLAALPWHIEAEDQKDKTQKAAADDIYKIINATDRWHHMVRYLAEAIWYGRYGAQLRWASKMVAGQERLAIADHRPVNGDKIQFQWDGTPGVYLNYQKLDEAKEVYPGAEIVRSERAPLLMLRDPNWRQRFIIHKHEVDDADYYDGEMAGGVHGVGLRSRIYWLWFLRDECLGWMLNYMKKVGSGGILCFFYEEGNANSKTAAENSAKDAGERYALAIPKPKGMTKDATMVELIPANDSGIVALQGIISEYFERHIERMVIGQNLSSKSSGTGLGSGVADFQKETKYKILVWDANNLSDTLSRDLVAVVHQWNDPATAKSFRLSHKFDLERPDPDKKLDAAMKIFGMGAKLKEDEVLSAGGFSVPEEGAEVLQQLEPQAKPGKWSKTAEPGASTDTPEAGASNDMAL